MNYWHIGTGSDQRNYSELFLKYGIAFAGSGSIGKKEVKPGDVLVFSKKCKGQRAIRAAGVVVKRNGSFMGCDDKEWLLDFDGWKLPEYCYVDWKKPNQPKKVNHLAYRDTLCQIHQPAPKKVVDHILQRGMSVSISPEPSGTREVKDNEILKLLVKEGLRSSRAYKSTIKKIKSLAEYYSEHYNNMWEDIGEHEIRTFLVVPLLLALGWSEQQIRIEFKCKDGRIDIACFRTPFRNKKNEELKKECVAIIETKSFGAGLDYAAKQAQEYSGDFPCCKAVIATNGYCYKVYLPDQNNQFHTTPSAYINLLRQRDRYPLDPKNIHGALEAIRWLLPNNLI